MDRPAGTKHFSIVAVLLVLAILHVALTRVSWRDIPIQTDVGIWSYIGARLNEGRRLYVDLWDSKPPGIYWVFAACNRLGGTGNDRPAFWLDTALPFAILGVSWKLARRFASAESAALAVFLASFICCHRILADWGCNVEKFVAVFEGLAILAGTRAIERRNLSAWLQSGIWAGLAGCFKQTAILYPVAAAIYLLFAQRRTGESLTARLRFLLVLAFGAALVWLPVLAWLLHRGELAGFWKLAVLYDLRRATPGSEAPRIASIDHWFDVARQFKLASALLLPAAVGAVIAMKPTIALPENARRGLGLVLLVVALELATFSLAPFGYGHYLLQLIPAAATLAAVAFQFVFFDPATRRPRTARRCAAAMFVALFTLADHLSFTLSSTHPARIAYAFQREAIDGWIHRIQSETHPDDAVLVWPPDYPLSYYARRRTPLEISNADVLFQEKSYRLDPSIDALLANIRSDSPALIIDRTHLKLNPLQDGRFEILVPENEISLYQQLNAQPFHPQVRLTAPLLDWVRANYGGQSRGPDGICLVLHQNWRDLIEVLRAPGN